MWKEPRHSYSLGNTFCVWHFESLIRLRNTTCYMSEFCLFPLNTLWIFVSSHAAVNCIMLSFPYSMCSNWWGSSTSQALQPRATWCSSHVPFAEPRATWWSGHVPFAEPRATWCSGHVPFAEPRATWCSSHVPFAEPRSPKVTQTAFLLSCHKHPHPRWGELLHKTSNHLLMCTVNTNTKYCLWVLSLSCSLSLSLSLSLSVSF